MSIDLDPIKQVIVQLNAGTQTELKNISNILGGNAAFTDAQKAAIKSQIATKLYNQIPAFSETFKKQVIKLHLSESSAFSRREINICQKLCEQPKKLLHITN
jgi:hypothetical protein